MTQTTIPDLNTQAIDNTGIFINAWQIYFQAIYKAIRAKFSANLSGIISISSTSKPSAGISSTDLNSYSLQKNTLVNNGDILKIEAWGTFAANTNNKLLTLEFGSQIILTTGTVAVNSGSWKIDATVIRKSPTSQEIIATIISSNSTVMTSATQTAGTQDLTTNLTVKITAQGVANNDIINNALIIGLTPND